MKTNKELADLQREYQKLEAKEKMEISSKKKLQGWGPASIVLFLSLSQYDKGGVIKPTRPQD